MFKQMMAAAPGAIAAGVARQVVGDRVNPSQRTLPVAKHAWWMDAATLALGFGAAYMGDRQRMPALEDFGMAVMTAGVAYTAQDVTQEVRRKMAPQAITAIAPTQVLQSRPVVALAQAQVAPTAYVGSDY